MKVGTIGPSEVPHEVHLPVLTSLPHPSGASQDLVADHDLFGESVRHLDVQP